MMRFQVDPCLLFKQDKGRLVAVVILQVDGSIIAGSNTFLDIEEKEFKTFVWKLRPPLQMTAAQFNGIDILVHSDGTIRVIHQEKKKSMRCQKRIMDSKVKER